MRATVVDVNSTMCYHRRGRATDAYHAGGGHLRCVILQRQVHQCDDGRRERVSTRDVNVRIPNEFGEATKGYKNIMNGFSGSEF